MEAWQLVRRVQSGARMDRLNHVKIVTPDPEAIDGFPTSAPKGVATVPITALVPTGVLARVQSLPRSGQVEDRDDGSDDSE